MSWDPVTTLVWPEGWIETTKRIEGKFTPKSIQGRAADIVSEVSRLGGRSLRITCEAPMMNPRAGIGFREAADQLERSLLQKVPGCAVYFQFKGKPLAIACDKFTKLEQNMRAIALTIEAIRGIERWGSSELMERSFAGFAELPSSGSSGNGKAWFEILGVLETASLDTISLAYRALAKKYHPDTEGGSEAKMKELNAAMDEAREAKKPC